MRWPPSSDDSSVVCEVHVPVDVAVTVGKSVSLSLSGGLLSRGAGLLLPIYHQLNPRVFPKLRRREGYIVYVLVLQQVYVRGNKAKNSADN